MPKGNEELKARIAKIQQKSKMPVPATPILPHEDDNVDEADIEALEAEFERKKKSIMEKKTQKQVETVEDTEVDKAMKEAIVEYADDAKFRVEVVYQLLQLNLNLKDIASSLKGLVNNEE